MKIANLAFQPDKYHPQHFTVYKNYNAALDATITIIRTVPGSNYAKEFLYEITVQNKENIDKCGSFRFTGPTDAEDFLGHLNRTGTFSSKYPNRVTATETVRATREGEGTEMETGRYIIGETWTQGTRNQDTRG